MVVSVASDVCRFSKFRGNTWRFKLLHWVSWTFAERCVNVVFLPTSIDTPYRKLFFRPDLTFKGEPWMLLYQYFLTGCHGAYAEYALTHDGSHDRTFVVSPIAVTHVPSSDHLTNRTMLSLHGTTLAFVAQRTHQDARHIARSITYHCTTLA